MFRAQAAQAEKSSPTEDPAGILPSGIFPAMPVVRHVFMSKLPQLTLARPTAIKIVEAEVLKMT